jgi:hypothetical protein
VRRRPKADDAEGFMTKIPARGRRPYTSLPLVLALVGLAWQAAIAQTRGPIEFQAELPAQEEAVQRALADLKPSQAGERRLFFVGFAGYGYEAVFKREVIAVRKLFDERFSTAGRSVALINHATTVDEAPLATRENLEQVLAGVGRMMDAERDTLFLFITSHGDRGVLAVEMPFMRLDHLTPGALKAMLARSGIKNRAIVVSACHSGSFIPALADARTLVITAARADRSSFGCNDKREWTYFGEAYFNQALRRETSFKKAFKQASELIKTWEAKEKLLPSLPQMKGGEALELGE